MDCCHCHKDLSDPALSNTDVFGETWCSTCYVFWDPDGSRVAESHDNHVKDVKERKYWWICACGHQVYSSKVPMECFGKPRDILWGHVDEPKKPCSRNSWVLSTAQTDENRHQYQLSRADKSIILECKST